MATGYTSSGEKPLEPSARSKLPSKWTSIKQATGTEEEGGFMKSLTPASNESTHTGTAGLSEPADHQDRCPTGCGKQVLADRVGGITTKRALVEKGAVTRTATSNQMGRRLL